MSKKESFRIFIVEDDLYYGNLLSYQLSLNPEFRVTLYETGEGMLNHIEENPDVICIDFGLPDISGDALLKKIKTFNASIPVVVVSGQNDIATALDLMKNGVADYLVKDDNTKDLLFRSILKIQESASLKKEVETLKKSLNQKYNYKNLVGKSSEMQNVFQLIEKATSSNINVCLTGETGTGKELVAKSIHFNSTRSAKPFVAVNMAAIPSELLESELFGHEKGAFTGAKNRKIGIFESANQGTLFLDEIGEMDLSIQSKILRALQEREFMRVGGTTIVKFDVRLVTATNKNLAQALDDGNFREDLYYRIMGLPIVLPSLRKRDGDVLLLAEAFIEEHAKFNKSKVCKLNREAKKKLLAYHWPGNVRELKAVVDLACVMCSDFLIQEEDIIFSNLTKKNISYDGKTLKQYTEEVIFDCLEKYKGNVLEVAKVLDIGKSTIYNLLKQTEKNSDVRIN